MQKLVPSDQMYYLHGLESSPQGFRAQFLRERYPQMNIPALTPDVFERHNLLKTYIQDNACLVGSSLGGLSGLMFVRDYAEKVKRMVLLAPAVGFHDPAYRTPEILSLVESLVVPAGIPTTIIAAIHDEVIPLPAIEALVKRSPDRQNVELVKVNDSHRLREPAALDAMTAAIEKRFKI